MPNISIASLDDDRRRIATRGQTRWSDTFVLESDKLVERLLAIRL